MTAKKPQKKKKKYEDSVTRARRQSNYIRILEFLVAIATLAVGIWEAVYPRLYLLMLAFLLAYPLVAQGLALYLENKGTRQNQASRVLVQIDALLIGLIIAVIQFALVPALALLIIVHANAVTSGGLRPWLLNILWTSLGLLAGVLLFGLKVLSPEAVPASMNLTSLVGLGIYVGASSFYAHTQTQYLRAAQINVQKQQKQAMEMSRKLAKYLPPQIWGSIFSGKRDAKLETRRKKLTVFFSDIKGFSNISEELPLSTLTKMLNTYLEEMTRIALHHGGTIDKFIGDAVMVFFGDPKSEGSQQDAFNCVAMAIDMQKRMKLLRQRWLREGIEHKLEIRIGINTGYVTVGNFGAESRMDYTILGTDVNLASRLESACRPGKILLSEATHELVKHRIMARNQGDIQVKGFNRPIPVYEVVDLRRNAGGTKSFISTETSGFAIHVEIEKIRNFDKRHVLKQLALAATRLKSGEDTVIEYETKGFALHCQPPKVKEKEKGKILEMLGNVAMKVKKEVLD